MVLLRRREPAAQAAADDRCGPRGGRCSSVTARPDNCAEKVRLYQLGDRRAGDELAQKFGRPGPQHRAARAGTGQARGVGRCVPGRFFCGCSPIWTNGSRKCPFCKWLAVVAARRAIDLSRLATPVCHLPAGRKSPTRGRDRRTERRSSASRRRLRVSRRSGSRSMGMVGAGRAPRGDGEALRQIAADDPISARGNARPAARTAVGIELSRAAVFRRRLLL